MRSEVEITSELALSTILVFLTNQWRVKLPLTDIASLFTLSSYLKITLGEFVLGGNYLTSFECQFVLMEIVLLVLNLSLILFADRHCLCLKLIWQKLACSEMRQKLLLKLSFKNMLAKNALLNSLAFSFLCWGSVLSLSDNVCLVFHSWELSLLKMWRQKLLFLEKLCL